MALEPPGPGLLAHANLETGESFELSESMPERYINRSWVYYLEEIDEGSFRLVVRWRGDFSPRFAYSLGFGIPTEAGALLMQPKMLRGIKARAEAAGRE